MSIRNGLVLLIIGLYMVLNWGFMLVRVPPGGTSGVPVGEILLLFFFLTFIWDMKWLPYFSRKIFLFPFLLWWVLGLGRALAAVLEQGLWALRRRDPRYRAHLVSTSPSCSSQVGDFPNFGFAAGIGIQA